VSAAPVVVERVLDATPEDVFAAWSDPESLSVWMCPGELRGASVEVDFRVGGRFRIAMHGGERDYVQHGEYLAIEPPKRIVLLWVSEWIDEAASRTRVEVTLEPRPGGRTRLVLVHGALPEGDAYDGHPGGWASILEKLAAHLTDEGRTR
jgi:uncharacterized protein YndB with AHSA1/START domain